MNSLTPSIFAAYCDYFATGEGRTLIIAASNTREGASRLFEDKAPKHFLISMALIDLTRDPQADRVKHWLPAGLEERARGPFSYFGMFHQNLS